MTPPPARDTETATHDDYMPDNANYYYAAYAVTVIMYGGYALSIALRRRALERRRRRQHALADAAARTGTATGTVAGER